MQTCEGGDLQNECIKWCKTLDVRCVTKETDPTIARAKEDNFKLKKGLWAENEGK